MSPNPSGCVGRSKACGGCEADLTGQTKALRVGYARQGISAWGTRNCEGPSPATSERARKSRRKSDANVLAQLLLSAGREEPA
jgi:hypothetical protein